MGKLAEYIVNPLKIVSFLDNRNLLNWMSDNSYLKLKYRSKIGKRLDLDNPQSFNAKLQWLKLNDKNPNYTLMVDKYAVKEYVAGIIGEEYIIPTLAVYDSFDEIDFDALPNQFVIKCTHDSGGLVICKDKSKLDIQSAKRKIEKCLNNNYFYQGREWPYKNVKPRIIVEKFMATGNEDLDDIKLMCFNGEVKCSFLCLERYSDTGLKVDFYDTDWNKMPFARKYPNSDYVTPKPQNYDKMVELAQMLSKDIPFVRVDFYEIEGKVFFGEMTFFPGSGYEPFFPEEWDYELGKWLDINNKKTV